MAHVDLSNQAKADLMEIVSFYYRKSSAIASEKYDALLKELERVAETSILGFRDVRLPEEYRYYLLLGRTYKVYFVRNGTDRIKVYRIYPARKPLLEPDEIVDVE